MREGGSAAQTQRLLRKKKTFDRQFSKHCHNPATIIHSLVVSDEMPW